jgi:hypothetical protein
LLIAVVVGLLTLVDMEDTRYKNTFYKWPTVSGTVISAERGETEVWDREGNITNPTLTITFSYVVQGLTYQGSQGWQFPEFDEDGRELEESRYPIGSLVTVYYDPTGPKRSLIDITAIDTRGTFGSWLGVVAVYLAIFGFISLVYIWGWWIRSK